MRARPYRATRYGRPGVRVCVGVAQYTLQRTRQRRSLAALRLSHPRSDADTRRPEAMSALKMACTMLSAASADRTPQVFVKPSPGLTCIVWSASGTKNKILGGFLDSFGTDPSDGMRGAGVAHTEEAIVELQNTQERCGSVIQLDHDLNIAAYRPVTEVVFFLLCAQVAYDWGRYWSEALLWARHGCGDAPRSTRHQVELARPASSPTARSRIENMMRVTRGDYLGHRSTGAYQSWLPSAVERGCQGMHLHYFPH